MNSKLRANKNIEDEEYLKEVRSRNMNNLRNVVKVEEEARRVNFVNDKVGCIDIPKFFKYVKTLSRGEIYRILNAAQKTIDDKWEQTYLRNSNKNYRDLVNYMKKIGINSQIIQSMEQTEIEHNRSKFKAGCSRHRNLPRAQALDDIFNFPSQVNSAVNGLNNVIPLLATAAEGITNVTTSITDMVTFINEIFKNWKQTISDVSAKIHENMYAIIEYVVKLTALAYLLSQPHNQNLANAIALLTLILPSSVTAGILPFAEGLIRVIKGMMGAQAHAEEDDGGFIKSFFQLTVGITKGLFGEVPKDVFDSLNISSRKVKLISDYIRGTSTIVDCITRIFSKVIELIGDGILKYFGYIPTFMKEENLTPLVDEFLQIKLDRLDVQCTIQLDAARKVVQLYEKLLKFESKLNRSIKNNGGNFNNFKQGPYLRIMIKTLEGCINRIPDHLRTGLTPRRVKPFWVYLYGDPRIGKTAVLQPHLVNALSHALKLINKYEDYTNYTYLRNCGEDYWEGYDNHPVLWYNDLFQNFAQDEKMHQAIMELTNIVDDNVYPLEMAFERKHCVYFSSQVVISNAQHDIINAGFIKNKCWSGGQHLYARRNVCVKLSLNPKYAAQHPDVGIDYAVMQEEMRTNPQNCIGYNNCTLHTVDEYDEKLLFPNDMYVMEFTNPSTGVVESTLNYADGINYVCQQAVAYKATQSAFKNKLYKHFEGMWAQSEEDEEIVEWSDARLATQSEWVESVMADVFRELETAVPGLIGSSENYRGYTARFNDGAMEYMAHYYSVNRDDEHRAYARVKVAVTLVGAEYFMGQNMSFWHKFCGYVRSWITTAWYKARHFITESFATLGPYSPVVMFAVGLYGYYKLVNIVNKFWLLMLGPKIIYVEKENKEQEVIAQNYINSYAQSHEAKVKPAVPQILRVPKRVGVAQSYDQQNTIVENIMNKQMCKFTIRVFQAGVEAHNRRFGSGICLGSDVFLVPYHFWYRWFEMKEHWEANGCEVKLCLQWTEELEVVLDWNAMSLCRLQYNHAEDLAYFRIKNLVQKPHIKKFFISSNDRPVLSTLYVYGRRASSFELTTMGVTDGEYKLMIYEHQSKDDPLYGGKFSKREICIPIALVYHNCCTSPGDCGTLVMHCDSSMNCKKVMAMHTAGHVVDGYGIGSLVFQEDINEVFDYFYPDGFNIAPVAMEFDEAEDTLGLKDLGLQILGKLPRLVVPEFKIDRYPVLMLPRKSKISHSVVYDIMEEDYGQSTVQPAHLRPYVVDDVKISPLYNALKKMVVVSPMPDESVAGTISQHMFETFATWKSTIRPRVFSDDEMINGCGLMNAIEMSTSAGYPYVILDNTSGKHPFFTVVSTTPMRYAPIKYLQRLLNEREDAASRGKIVPTFFIDTLKDETRPVEKVKQGKTRLFQISPLDFNLLLRKYFGAFLCHTQETFIVGESAVGINANSYEWTLMIKSLMEVGDSFINGDGKNFDASASQPIAMHNVYAINKWYQLGNDWKLEHDRIRCTLWATFLNSWHIVRNVVYVAQQGNKSGTAVTTQFNNLIGMFAIRWTYLLAGYQLHDFHRAIKPKFYGDDDLTAVNTVLAPKVTCKSHKITMAKMGIEYTSATKNDVVDTWYNISEITFLKRKFYWDGIRYLPQLDHTVIFEIARWSESDPENMVDQMNRFNSSLLELSNYGRLEFTQLRDRYVEYTLLIRKKGLVISPTQLFSYDYCEYIKWGDLYKPAQLSIDRAFASDVARVVQYESAANDVKLSNSENNFGLNFSENTQTATAQTHEAKNVPPKAQIVRISRPKAQGEEIDESNDFELYLTMMDYLKEMEPCFRNFERALMRNLRTPIARDSLILLQNKIHHLIAIYSECTNLLRGHPQAQSEEFQKVKGMNDVTNDQTKLTDVDDSLGSQDVVQQKITTFINTVETHQPSISNRSVPKSDNSNIYTDMETYFKRPTLFDSFTWHSTDIIWSTLGTWDFPKNYFSIDQISNKLAMVMYTRPDFEFEIVCNSTAFHYGRLLFVVIPFYQDGPTRIPKCYDSPFNATTWPHWYQISAGSKQTVKFTVPYRHVYSQMQVNSTDPSNRYMFSIRCYVSVPLCSANASTAGPVEITLYCSMSEPRLSGNTISASAQGEEVTLSKQRLTGSNPVTDANPRVISAVLDGTAKVTKDLSQLAFNAGCSIPANLGATSSMQVRQPLMNKANDLPNSVVLGGDMQAKVIPTSDYVNAETEDDMNINYIVSSPCLLETIEVDTSKTIGESLFYHYLTPRAMKFGGAGFINDPTTDYFLPVGYLSNFFSLWRGGWKFHFSAVCSGFHSLRVRISYFPAGTGTTIGVPSENMAGARTSSFVRNVVWDISKNTEVTLRIPYETNTHWRHTNTECQDALGGLLYMQVLNTLTSATASSITNPIFIQVFVSADDDFQFAYPGRRAIGPERVWAPDLASAQGEETGCSLPSSSASCLREQKGLLMGDVDSRRRKFHDCVSIPYTSVKQLANQLTPIEWFQSSTLDPTTINGRRYSPYGHTFTANFNDSFWLAPLHCIIPMFRFMRGSFRMYMFANKDLQIGATANAFPEHLPVYQVHNHDILNGSGGSGDAEPLATGSYGYAHFYDSSLYPADVIIPYFHTQPCILTNNGFASDTLMVPYGTLSVSTQKSVANVIVCVGGGDDLMLGYRMSIPRVRKAAEPTLLSAVQKEPVYIDTTPANTLTETKLTNNLKLKRNKRSFIDRLMEASDESSTESQDDSN